MGIKKLILITLLLCLHNLYASTFVQYSEFVNLSKNEQVQIIEKLQDYLVELEHNRDRVVNKKHSSIETLLNKVKAYAQDTPIAQSKQSCIYGGWTSLASNNYCANPRRLSPSNYSYKQSALILKTNKYDSDAIKIAKLNGDSYNQLEIDYYKGRPFVNIMPTKNADGFIEVKLNKNAKRGAPNSCNINQGDMFCNPAVYGRLAGKALCVSGDKDHKAYNSSFLCNKAVKHLKKTSPEEYNELMSSIITNAQVEPGKTLFIQNLYSMYDMCICNGAASNFLNKRLANKMYNSRTCIGLMEQSSEVYAFVSDNKCTKVYEDSKLGGLSDWSSFAKIAYDQVTQELLELRSTINSKIGNYKGVKDFNRSNASVRMNKNEEITLSQIRDKTIESRPLPSYEMIKICRAIKPSPIKGPINYSININTSKTSYQSSKLVATIAPEPDFRLDETSWKLLTPKMVKNLKVNPNKQLEADLTLINSKRVNEVIFQTSINGEALIKKISIPNYQLSCNLEVGKIDKNKYKVDIKLLLGRIDVTSEWIKGTTIEYSIENVKNNIITTQKEVNSFELEISKDGHDSVNCSYSSNINDPSSTSQAPSTNTTGSQVITGMPVAVTGSNTQDTNATTSTNQNSSGTQTLNGDDNDPTQSSNGQTSTSDENDNDPTQSSDENNNDPSSSPALTSTSSDPIITSEPISSSEPAADEPSIISTDTLLPIADVINTGTKPEDSTKLEIINITKADALSSDDQTLEAKLNLPNQSVDPQYKWDLKSNDKNIEQTLSPINNTKQVTLKLYHRKEPHIVSVTTTIDGEKLTSKLNVDNYLLSCHVELTKGDKQDNDEFKFSLIPKITLKDKDMSSWLSSDVTFTTSKEVTSKDEEFYILSESEPKTGIITYSKKGHDDLVCSIAEQNTNGDLIDLDAVDDDAADEEEKEDNCSLSLKHNGSELEVKIELDGKSIDTVDLFNESGLSFALHHITEEDPADDTSETDESTDDEMVDDTQVEESQEDKKEGEYKTNNPFDIKVAKTVKPIVLKAYLESADKKSCSVEADLTINAKSTYTPPVPGKAPPARRRSSRYYRGRL